MTHLQYLEKAQLFIIVPFLPSTLHSTIHKQRQIKHILKTYKYIVFYLNTSHRNKTPL